MKYDRKDPFLGWNGNVHDMGMRLILIFPLIGVHRSMGTHISKVRSLELDLHIWTDTLIKVQ